MIRLREENYPPVYQLDLSLRLLRSGLEDLSLEVLKAQPLYPVRTIEVTYLQEYQSTLPYIHSMPWEAIQVPMQQERSVKVCYVDALEPYQTANDKLWSSEEWGIYRYHIRDWFEDDPYSRMDLDTDDMRYHKFQVSHFHVFTIEDTYSAVVWDDIYSGEKYCAEARVTMSTGGKVT